jgi:hypothetical protein
MEQTAVEWLYETLWKDYEISLPSDVLQKAQEIEKQRAIDFGYDIADKLACGVYQDKKDVEELYNEFFKPE